MELNEAIKVLNNEKACVERNIKSRCNKDCAKCDFLMEDDVILNGYDMAIEALKKQIPKKVIQTQGDCCWVAKDGTEDHYIIYSCPSCGSKELIHGYPCKCNQALDWS